MRNCASNRLTCNTQNSLLPSSPNTIIWRAGMFNCMTVQPLASAERIVFYRERAASMYSPGPYSLAISLAEVWGG